MRIFLSPLEKHKQDLDDEMLYGIVAEEMARNSISPGLYAKALSDMAGDESKTLARYIKLRVNMLRTERSAIVDQLMHQEQNTDAKTNQLPLQANTPNVARILDETAGLGFKRLAAAGLVLFGVLIMVMSLAEGNLGGAGGGFMFVSVFAVVWAYYTKKIAVNEKTK